MFAIGCNSQASQVAAKASPNNFGFDACSLIDAAQIASVQRGTVKSADASQQKSGNLVISRCHYVVTANDNANASVHVELIQSDSPANIAAIADYWKKSERRAEMKGEEEEEGREAAEAREVSGAGEEAFWFGNEKAGVLFARHNNRILRISVGGPGSAETKIESSKALAKLAFDRLSKINL